MIQKVVVFDLDETLLSKDSMKTWFFIQFKNNILRLICLILLSPFVLLLLFFRKYRIFGISLLTWIATYGLSKSELEQSFKCFAQHIKEHKIPSLYWYSEGILELQNHLNAGHRVILATASPEMLAIFLLQSLNIQIEIVGTPLQQKFGGWIATSRCWHNEKVRRLSLLNVQKPWLASYSDNIKDDYPILINCKYPNLINGNDPKKVNTHLQQIKHLTWHRPLNK